MRNLIVGILFCLLVAGCGKQPEAPEESLAEVPVSARHESAQDPGRYMAYEHSVNLEVEEDQVESIHKSLEVACRQAVSDECVIIESNLWVGREVSAEVKLRAKPEGIKKIIASVISQGKVARQSVTAEDLAVPIGDSTKKLKMLQDYRSQLEVLRGKAGGNVESLIKVSKELAEVQSAIEALSGDQAQLYRRVQTELLRVSVSSRNVKSFWRPVGNAFGDFSANLAGGIATAITALAYLIPWMVLLTAFWLGIRKLRSRNK